MKIGIVGSGKIVTSLLASLANVTDINCNSICVREESLEKVKILCNKYKIENIYTDYEKFLASNDFDFVYIGILNTLHFEYSYHALESGKNVICEKPFTTNVKDLKKLIDLSKSKKLFLFEAITTIHMPNYKYIKGILPKLKNIKLVQSNFSQFSSRYVNYLNKEVHPVFIKEDFGGALYDMNVYNLHLVIDLFGLPKKSEYFFNKGFNDVDTSGTMILKYNDFIAVCTAAKDSKSPNFTIIQGENGYIKIYGPANTCDYFEVLLDGEFTQHNFQDEHDKFIYEFNDFNNIYQNKDYDECYRLLNESLMVMKILKHF